MLKEMDIWGWSSSRGVSQRGCHAAAPGVTSPAGMELAQGFFCSLPSHCPGGHAAPALRPAGRNWFLTVLATASIRFSFL